MFYVCVNTPKGYVTLSAFNDRKTAIGHKLDWYWLNVQYSFKVLTKCRDNAKDDLFTEPRKLIDEDFCNKPKINKPIDQPVLFLEYKGGKEKKIQKSFNTESYFLEIGEETVYKPVARKPRSNDSDFRKFLLTADPKSPCIYAIRCKTNGIVYIGKTNNFLIRAKDHFVKLKEKRHDNKHLQADWNIHGKENFSIEVIEICSISELTKLELYFIDKFGHRAYNILDNKCKGFYKYAS